jgi:hypothetical protein
MHSIFNQKSILFLNKQYPFMCAILSRFPVIIDLKGWGANKYLGTFSLYRTFSDPFRYCLVFIPVNIDVSDSFTITFFNSDFSEIYDIMNDYKLSTNNHHIPFNNPDFTVYERILLYNS